MPRHRFLPDQHDLHALADAIRKQRGRDVKTATDIATLQQEIARRKPGEILGANTLRRFFGLITSVHLPTLTTLNILSRYAGYNDWTDFVHVHHQENVRQFDHALVKITYDSRGCKRVMEITDNFGDLPETYRFLSSYFNGAPTSLKNEFISSLHYSSLAFRLEDHTAHMYDLYYFGQYLLRHIYDLPDPRTLKIILADSRLVALLTVVGVTPNPNNHVFEQLLKGYVKIYPSQQTELFKLGIQYFRCINSSSAKKRNELYDLLKSIRVTLHPDHIDLKPIARRRAVFLQHETEAGKACPAQVLKAVHDEFGKIRLHYPAEQWNFYGVEIARVLFRKGHFQEGMQLLDEILPEPLSHIGFWSGIHWNRLNIYRSGFQYYTGRKKEARRLYETIDPDRFENFHEIYDETDYYLIGKLLRG